MVDAAEDTGDHIQSVIDDPVAHIQASVSDDLAGIEVPGMVREGFCCACCVLGAPI